MNTLKAIYDKLGKTELAKHEVELANINDFVKLTTDADKKLKQFNDLYTQLMNLAPTIIKSGQVYEQALNNAMDLYNELFSKFKEIGLDFTTTPEAKAFKSVATRGERSTIVEMITAVKKL